MAWYKRYSVAFQSRKGTQYVAYIKEKTNATMITLTGAAEPFTTSEEDKDDIFTPFRGQTGYLRVIDETGGNLLEQVIPQTNTEKMVELWEVTRNGAGVTDDKLCWRGFMEAAAYTQPWDEQKNVLEFPLKSVVASLENIQINTAMAGSTLLLSRTIYEGITALLGDAAPEKLYMIGDISGQQWMRTFSLNYGVFFNKETIQNVGVSTSITVGNTYKECIESVLRLVGLTMREEGGNIILAKYDTNGYDVKRMYYDWATFVAVSTGVSQAVPTLDGSLPEENLLNSVSFRRSGNSIKYLQGHTGAKITVKIDDEDLTAITLPETEESSEEPNHVLCDIDEEAGDFSFEQAYCHIQPHSPRTGIESFFFAYHYHRYRAGDYKWKYEECTDSATMNNCIYNSVLRQPYYTDRQNPYNNYQNICTGAFPVRWLWEKDGNTSLQNGLMLIQGVVRKYPESGMLDTELNDNTNKYVYSINSGSTVEIIDSYLNIDMNCFRMIVPVWTRNTLNVNNWYFYKQLFYNCLAWYDSLSFFKEEDIPFEMVCSLSVGSYYWNGGSWVQDSNATFNIPFVNENIVSNKNNNMNVDVDSGYFIEVGNMTGVVTFKILYYEITSLWENTYHRTILSYSKIISGLNIGVVRKNTIQASTRNTNVYRRTIMTAGFSDEKEISLGIGTMNGNRRATNLIRQGTTYPESLPYTKDGGEVNERPEMHLLERISTQYNQVRRTMKANIETGVDIFRKRFAYKERHFMAIDKKHNWEREEQEVKFIEVS